MRHAAIASTKQKYARLSASHAGGQTPDEAVRSAGDRVPLKRDRPDDLRKREREHREIDAREPHAEPAEDERADAAPRRGASDERRHIGQPCVTASAAA